MMVASLLTAIICLLAAIQISLSEEELLMDSQPSSIEAGFEKMLHSSFLSSPFFFMAVLFVLFDVELVLLLPTIMDFTMNTKAAITVTALVAVITVTLAAEWSLSGLKWAM